MGPVDDLRLESIELKAKIKFLPYKLSKKNCIIVTQRWLIHTDFLTKAIVNFLEHPPHHVSSHFKVR